MFEGLKALWDSMTPAELAAKIEALKQVTALKSLCEAKGYANCDVQKMRLEIFVDNDEVKNLRKALKAGGISGMKIIKKKVSSKV